MHKYSCRGVFVCGIFIRNMYVQFIWTQNICVWGIYPQMYVQFIWSYGRITKFVARMIEFSCTVTWSHQRLITTYSYNGLANIYLLQWHHNGHVSNHQPHDCLLNRLFRRISKKTSKLRVTGLCAGNSPETGEFPAQMASNAENVSIWWRHHSTQKCRMLKIVKQTDVRWARYQFVPSIASVTTPANNL